MSPSVSSLRSPFLVVLVLLCSLFLASSAAFCGHCSRFLFEVGSIVLVHLPNMRCDGLVFIPLLGIFLCKWGALFGSYIVDTLGPGGHHIAQSSDLHRLLFSFHRDRPKSSRNLPKWNLSVVLNELTKAPFEIMKDTDLKHLTLKTAFLLVLAQRNPCLGCKQSI